MDNTKIHKAPEIVALKPKLAQSITLSESDDPRRLERICSLDSHRPKNTATLFWPSSFPTALLQGSKESSPYRFAVKSMTPTSDEEQALGSMKAAPSPPEPKEPVTSDSDSKKAAPPQKKKAATPKENREVNPRYKDVKETGKWGDISTSEIYVAVGIGILVIIGITLGLVFGIDNNNEPQVRTRTPEIVSPEVKLFLAFEAINVSEFTYLLQQDLSTNVADYEGLWQDSSASPQERAMSWLLFEDVDWNSREEIGERWALASIYYALGGDDWTTATNWLSSEPVCEWDHINCDSFLNTIDEIDLSNNNLVGTIPNEFVMFNATQSLWLRENSLTGPVPNEAFGSMPRLSILYLDNNKLTGTISSEIRNNGVLNSLFIQANDLTGEWPRIFCQFSAAVPPQIVRKGLDCNEVQCLPESCCDAISCFYDEDDTEA